MRQLFRLLRRKREGGQSLVEVALFFPIFVILLAGLVEVSQLVIAQNRVSNAARVGARFGANGGDDDGMVATALNSVTQTLSLSPSDWDIWVIRATVDSNGTGFSQWSFEHVYGISNTVKFPSVNEQQVQADVLAELQKSGNPATAGIRIVGTHAIYDVNSILGLNAVPLVAGINSVEDLNVMRIIGFTHSASDGCDAFPIAVERGIRSVQPPDGRTDPYPSRFGAGSPSPAYTDFTYHVPDVPLDQAKPGYIYKIRNGFGQGSFGWIVWNEGVNASSNTLNGSLTYPGNSLDYTSVAPGQTLPGWPHPVFGYVEPGDPTDSDMQIGDWVAANTGVVNSNAIRTTITDHITKERTLRIIMYDTSKAQGQGVNGRYLIDGFAIFRLHGFDLPGSTSNSWILAEFVGWDNSCGQPPQGP